MKDEIKNYGFVPEEVEKNLDETHYLLGSTSKLGTDILQADGNWLPYIPAYEPQFTPNYDTYGCTVFGTLNALEVLMKKLHGGDYDFAERFIYILAGIRAPGGDPHKVAEIIRAKGLIEQALLPLTITYDEFIQPDPMTQSLLDKAHEFLNDKEIGHEWIFTNNPNTADRIQMLKWALQRGTVAMSVTAWYQDENGLYIDGGRPNTHWVCLVDIEEKDGKFYPIIIDSYDLILYGKSTAYFKKLHPDHKVFYAKRYAILPKKNTELTPAQTAGFLAQLQRLWDWLMNIQREVDVLKKEQANKPPVVVTTPLPPAPPTPVPTPAPKYQWDTSQLARHSIRVICDEQGLSLANKNLITAVIQAESGFYNYKDGKPLKRLNFKKDGVTLSSTDWGICQINDTPTWHIGKGLYFASVDDVMANPDKAVRFMIAMLKADKLNLWVAYINGSYIKFL